MQGPIAQAVAIVAHANAARRGLRRAAFFPGNSTCEHCEWVRFVDGERLVAPTPDAWFDGLAARGVRRVRLAYEPTLTGIAPDVHTVAFAGGGGAWQVLCDGQGGAAEAWRSRWVLGDREAADGRIWQVTYGRLEARDPREGPPVARAAEGLERSLQAIHRFSRARANGSFAEDFERALAALRTGEPRGHHEDLAPAGALPSSAVRLLDACQAAWVFGGMGWWNDQSFGGEDARDFERVTAEHWSAVTAAIVAATNASAAPS